MHNAFRQSCQSNHTNPATHMPSYKVDLSKTFKDKFTDIDVTPPDGMEMIFPASFAIGRTDSEEYECQLEFSAGGAICHIFKFEPFKFRENAILEFAGNATLGDILSEMHDTVRIANAALSLHCKIAIEEDGDEPYTLSVKSPLLEHGQIYVELTAEQGATIMRRR